MKINIKIKKLPKLRVGNKIKLKLLLPYLKKTDKIIDLGCGNMWLTNYLRSKGYSCVGFDIDKPADIVGDIKNYKFKKKSYDVVIALEMIEHVDCFNEISYLLKPKGILILSTPTPHLDWFCYINERLEIFQKRTSPHSNLFYLKEVPFMPIHTKTLYSLVQFGVFKNQTK
ncbi:MAG: hypothetical protein COX79_00105 [Candidatus Levybacteria bacterium CG_4_10_14_0_2_um_filter_36_16]|nr:MAG: hypothetical protein AUK12_00695 [Candidatus Levybacteria bacterium CG2_30_37_29]PIR78837.1 MAG: hypothetical protein COU26_04410 [Candidatus Levybacteria bacterium CG10_big_fil_rev_8_21_14_0_10_36_30]PIZ98042.1 MAG: hypothetical protein COX79_00105 [Candidatus Levybacteria bacterium CG_4_10_14_0_2_um_filter_36_16]